jgi:hypothetical protein
MFNVKLYTSFDLLFIVIFFKIINKNKSQFLILGFQRDLYLMTKLKVMFCH